MSWRPGEPRPPDTPLVNPECQTWRTDGTRELEDFFRHRRRLALSSAPGSYLPVWIPSMASTRPGNCWPRGDEGSASPRRCCCLPFRLPRIRRQTPIRRLAPWFRSLMQPGTSISCCSISDCRATEYRVEGDHYEALVGETWFPVPPERILQRTDNPTGRAVVCWTPQRGIVCFVRATESVIGAACPARRLLRARRARQIWRSISAASRRPAARRGRIGRRLGNGTGSAPSSGTLIGLLFWPERPSAGRTSASS